MAYFLKKSKHKNHTYLAIYESFYSPDSKGTRHKSFRSLGSIDSLIAQGIEDPIAFYQKEVDALNLDFQQKKESIRAKKISERSPERYLGYFPLATILNNLDIEQHFRHMQSNRRFHFSIYDIFRSLCFARVVAPCSKNRTFHDVLPSMFNDIDYSYDQLLDGLEFLGSEYEKFIEILTTACGENYGIDTKHTFFDCTNFYFEIDQESDLQKKGPSKEKRNDPIIGMGLLLDADMIPINMRLYPGNESEKPILRETISSLKQKNNIHGRTIQIADKGLNCAKNIIEATNMADGYIFSKSVKQLAEKEKRWVLLNEGYKDIYDRHGNLLYRYKSCIDDFEYRYKDDDGRMVHRKVTEKRVCTFNPKLARKKNMEIDRLVNKARKMNHYQAKKSEYGECGKYVTIENEDGKKPRYSLNEAAIEKDRELAGYNLLVTSEINMQSNDIYDAYHNLWRIEESFRVMKSELDARPVFLQKEDCIKGHFLICYASVLLLRLFQVKVLHNKYPTSQICDFMKSYKVVMINKSRYINITRSTEFIRDMDTILHHPVTNYYLTEKQIKMMLTR